MYCINLNKREITKLKMLSNKIIKTMHKKSKTTDLDNGGNNHTKRLVSFLTPVFETWRLLTLQGNGTKELKPATYARILILGRHPRLTSQGPDAKPVQYMICGC